MTALIVKGLTWTPRRTVRDRNLNAISGSGVIQPCLCSKRQKSFRLRQKGLVQRAAASGNGVLSDSNVPEGHRGLHGALYGEGGAEIHAATKYNFRKGEDDGDAILDVKTYLVSRDGERPLGVYAVYDGEHNVQYIGYSRNIVLALKKHLANVGEDVCAFVRVMVFMNKAMTTRENLEREAMDWIDHEGTLPPGNGAEKELWEGTATLGVDAMSSRERETYEEKKNKMRKAMGANLHDDVPGESLDSKERRLRLIKAVEGDNWSAVISEQTRETLTPEAAAAAQPSQEAIISPFAQAPIHRSVGNVEELCEADMNAETVNKALDEVRPYLIADGGNVEVVNVEEGNVFLRLQGACGTCPSSTATMKMGIERVLKSTFGEQLIEVIQLDQQDTSANEMAVDEHLNLLRPAIEGYGGSVDVVSVSDGVCELKYSGPAPIGVGIKAAIKDKFPDVKEVILQ